MSRVYGDVKQPATHSMGGGFGRMTLCGREKDGLDVRTDPLAVTCKRCIASLRMIGDLPRNTERGPASKSLPAEAERTRRKETVQVRFNQLGYSPIITSIGLTFRLEEAETLFEAARRSVHGSQVELATVEAVLGKRDTWSDAVDQAAQRDSSPTKQDIEDTKATETEPSGESH